MQTKHIVGIILATVAVFSLGIGAGLYLKKTDDRPVPVSGTDKTIPENMPAEEQKADDQPLIGGQKDAYGCLPAAGYVWCPSQKKCLRVWEEYCKEYKDQYKGKDTPEEGQNAPGDTGENPPAESVNWPKFEDQALGFHFQYPSKYKAVADKYGWPHSVIHLIKTSGGQSYDMTVEVWDSEVQATNAGRTGNGLPYFAMVEQPYTGKLLSFSCWNNDTAQDCDDIYHTFGFDQ